MKQILSHYQAVLPIHIEDDKVIDIENLLLSILFGEEYTDNEVAGLNEIYKHLIPDVFMDREDDEIARISFTREARYFPTMYPENCGCRIMYKGKEYFVGYDAEDRFIIGFNGSLYYFDDQSIDEDCEVAYMFIFKGILPDHLTMEKEDV